jgi:hypothetical protein
MKARLLATLAAIAVQPIVFCAWFLLPLALRGADISPREASSILLYVVLFATCFVVFLGLPAFLILKRFNRLNWRSVSLLGFIIASVPLAIYSWPVGSRWSGYSSGGNWHGRQVDFYSDGVATTYGWLNYGEGILAFGLQGLAGALIFYFVWRKKQA